MKSLTARFKPIKLPAAVCIYYKVRVKGSFHDGSHGDYVYSVHSLPKTTNAIKLIAGDFARIDSVQFEICKVTRRTILKNVDWSLPLT